MGKTLKDLQLRNKYGFEVIAVKDALSDTFHLIPGSNFKIPADSALLIIGQQTDIDKIDTQDEFKK